ncbi:MAG TPA: cyclic nucleotide-binding domain-containing protein [Acidimicrobiia bacterium]|nr:cyclic nucleotide-binding domain-containing protein [Acidimicrobiia bacterium]
MRRYRNRIDRELAEVPLLRGLSSRQLALVDRLSTPVELPAGEYLAQQGLPGAEFFILLDGRVEVVQDRKLVATRGPGAPLGEIALLGGRRRTATLIAQTPVRARVASRPEFTGLVAEIPELGERLQATMEERLAS